MIWNRFYRRDVEHSEVPPVLVIALLSLSLVPSFLGLSGALGFARLLEDLLGEPQLRELVHIFFDSSAAVLALVIGTLAVVRRHASPIAQALAPVMPFVVLLDTVHIFGGRFAGSLSLERSIWTWTVSRSYFALALAVSVAVVVLRSFDHHRARRLPNLGALLLGGSALVLALFAGPSLRSWTPRLWDPLIPRPSELPSAALWIFLLVFLLPRLHRSSPSASSSAALISMIPQVICQLEMAFGSTLPLDAHFLLAHWQRLLAYLALFAGMILDSHYDRQEREQVISDYESVQVELERQTSELEILDERRIRELAASEAKFQSILDNASDLVQTVDSEGRFLYVNPAWKKVLGYSAGKLREITWWDILHPDDHGEFRGLFTRALSGESFPGIEVVFLARGGREIFVEGNITVLASDEQPVAVQGIFRDITERKETEAMKEAFISTVSHELRTPLTSIYGSLCLLESGDVPPDQMPEYIAVAIRNSDRLLRLINDLLDLQRLAAGKTDFKIEPIDVLPILEQEVASMQSYAVGRGVSVVLGEIAGPCSCLADRERLAQVLDNLLSNAVKFSPEGATVTVTADDLYDRIRISVIDRGPGIPEEFQHRLFDQFSQLDPSATRRAGGSGLGLSIARGMTEKMGGSITFETSPTEGTTFHLDFLSSDG